MDDARRLMLRHFPDLRRYHADYVTGSDAPAVVEILDQELAKINDTNLETHPMQASQSLAKKLLKIPIVMRLHAGRSQQSG